VIVNSKNEKITLHDCRIPDSDRRQAGFKRGSSGFTDVRYVPGLENMFVASENRVVRLYDVRMSFGSSGEGEGEGGVLLKVFFSFLSYFFTSIN